MIKMIVQKVAILQYITKILYFSDSGWESSSDYFTNRDYIYKWLILLILSEHWGNLLNSDIFGLIINVLIWTLLSLFQKLHIIKFA